ncbi:hypothetical protein JOJ86_006770 [Rhodococcus percolatus]|uniref:RICIN domain-containing protein n=1 Tax=Rhodococcus opacus TaxID=37919 RepID=UPI0015FDC560|nr:hypothetical protein [Rhodococcus opacus]MBA8962427.1 hypothetical protein [Rhodococcus opacus]MBP2209044.1 hypothetical protein [Rhodococcus opacus]
MTQNPTQATSPTLSETESVSDASDEWFIETVGGKSRIKSWKGDYLHRPDSPRGVTTWDTGPGNEWFIETVGGKSRLKSWKGDYLHRPDSPRGVTTWDTGLGNEWFIETVGGKSRIKSWKGDYLYRPDSPHGVTTRKGDPGYQWTKEVVGDKIRLKSWKGDYLHRPDSPRGVTTWDTGLGNEWFIETVGDKIRLKSWKGDYLHRPDSPRGVTTWDTGLGNEWFIETVGDEIRLKSWKGDYLYRPDSPRGVMTRSDQMSSDLKLLEGWAVETFGKAADHTYVSSPENGKYFNCFGGHAGPNPRKIVEGLGNYAIADCYRQSWIFATPLAGYDTAGIIYGIEGVCHQAANRFLYSANVTLDLKVSGYWLSTLLYGVYGTTFRRWLDDWYFPCSSHHPSAADGVSEPPEHPLIERIREIHTAANGLPTHTDLVDETAAVTRYFAPDVDPEQFRDIQLQYLQERDTLAESGLTGERLAERLNDLGRRMQGDLVARLGPTQYEKLNGVPADVQVDLIEPNARQVVGEPESPPPERP